MKMTTHLLPTSLLLVCSMIMLISVFLFRKQLLISLISLELTALMVFLTLIFHFTSSLQPLSICFYMLIMSACEASLALSLLVMMTRIKGNDLLSMISNNKF